jgi:regulation of enolase protein 1 (concanavalin A-like superfamily)
MYLRGVLRRGAALGIFLSVASVNVAYAQSPLPPPWAAEDIGDPVIPGATTISATAALTMYASGADVWGTSDEFHFAYVPVSGDVDISVRVDSVAPTSSWAKAGVMIRASLAANSAHAFSLVSYSKGVAFQRRPAAGGGSVSTPGALGRAPYWVRLVRLGTLVTAYSSVDGSDWTEIGRDTIDLGTIAYVGFAATSRSAYVVGKFGISQVAMSVPTRLPDGQVNADIGAPALKGSASFSGGAYTITAGGTDIWGSSDQFHYVYQRASGDIDVKARVASISYADQWSKAGVMIRASLDADSAHGMALLSAGKGSAFQRRNTDGALSVNTSGGTAGPPGWVRLKRTGSLVTAYRSTDGVNWVTIGSDSIVLPDQVYVGIAATSHIATGTTTVTADNFSVVETAPAPAPAPPPPNAAPVVSLATNGTSFSAPASIALTATASDAENQLTRVEFYSGTTLLATDTAAPYAFTWSGVAAGTYALKAVAYDAQGGAGTSSTITVTVSGGSTSTGVKVAFTTSASDAALATEFVLEFFAANANPATATPIKRQSLGKPALDATGTATVDITTAFNSLAAGNYLATVSAVWSGGMARSAGVTVTK